MEGRRDWPRVDGLFGREPESTPGKRSVAVRLDGLAIVRGLKILGWSSAASVLIAIIVIPIWILVTSLASSGLAASPSLRLRAPVRKQPSDEDLLGCNRAAMVLWVALDHVDLSNGL